MVQGGLGRLRVTQRVHPPAPYEDPFVFGAPADDEHTGPGNAPWYGSAQSGA